MKVLVVDDEEGICKRLQQELRKEGYEVDYTTSPVGVLEKIKEAKEKGKGYELLLLDLRMPQMNGFELLKQIREVYLDLDVIIITGYGDEAKATEAIRIGAFDYLRKPISMEELRTAVFRVRQKRAATEKKALKHRMLVVDDEPDLCERVKRELEKEGYEAAVAHDGFEGLEYFKNNRVDAVIADIRMPMMDGLEMLDKCREITDDFVSIVITGYGDHETAIEALKLGAFDYLKKPISLDELITSVSKGIEVLELRRGLAARKRELEIESELKEQYAKKIEREKNFSANIIATVPDSLLVLDKDLRIKSANRTFYETFRTDIEPEKVIGTCITDIFGYENGRLGTKLTNLFGTGDMLENFELHYLSEKLGERIFNITARGMLIAEGGGELVVIGDITERKRAQEERERLLEELEASNIEMERYIYTVSHDLRSPLVTIQGFVGMLREDLKQNQREAEEKDLKYIENAAIKMDRLLTDTLELSRIGRVVNPPEDVPFGEIVKEAMDQTSEQTKSSGVEITVAEDFPAVHVDQMRIVEVLVNLIGNGINFMAEQPHPKIEIGYRIDGEGTVFFVRDNGIGIDKSQHEKVFGLFYQVEKNNKGTGVGLAIVKRIIEGHNGRIWIESEEGKGCTVCFTLPVV